MLRRSARRSAAADTTEHIALQAISPNVRVPDVSGIVPPSSAKTTAAVKTPGKRLQPQQTPTTAYSTAKRPRVTPGRGWLKPTTPHGARALESRRAGLTPGRTRRQSARIRRETPRDLLRALSRVLPRQQQIEKQDLEPTLEVDENVDEPANRDASSDDTLEEPPRLSFGVDADDQQPEVERFRRASDRPRLSMADSSMLGATFTDMEDSDEDEEKPVTRLLDASFDSDDLEPPDEPTFGDKDQPGDTIALRQLMALTRSPETPQNSRDPATPTANLSFALDIPEFPRPDQPSQDAQSDAEELDEYSDNGGFDIQVPDDDMPLPDYMAADSTEVVWDRSANVSPLKIAETKPLELQLAQKQVEKKISRKTGSSRAPRRDGLSKGIVKRVATSFIPSSGIKKGRLKRGAIDALMQATDWFFEQASEDLAAYSKHAGRKKIDESDLLLLARRQRLLTTRSTLFSLANKFLPRELLRDVRSTRMQPKGKGTQRGPGKSKRRDADEDVSQVAEHDEVDDGDDDDDN